MLEDALLATTALILGASALFSLAAWLRSLGRAEESQLNRAALVLLLAIPCTWARGHGPVRGALTTLGLMGASAWALRVGWRLLKSPSVSEDPALATRRRRIGFALCLTPAGFAPIASLPLSPQELALGTVYVAAMLATCVACLRLGNVYSERGDSGRASAARLFFVWSACGLALPVWYLGGPPLVPALLACALFPLAAPLMLRHLLPPELSRLRAPPTAATAPTSLKTRLAPTALLGLLALAALALNVSRHWQRCDGDLVAVPAPSSWRDLNLVADSDGENLGPFKFRASHFDYKGYPSAYTGASLGDPKLCFAGGVDLSSWFDGDRDIPAMYRSPAELHLRQVAGSPTFVVTAQSGKSETLVTAFQRRRGAQRRFDATQNLTKVGAVLGAIALGALGLALSAWLDSRKRERAARAWRWGAALAFIAALLTSTHLEQAWSSDSTPRPGRELAVEHAWLI